MEKTPLKRNKHLVSLSREHHFSLLFCWKIDQGLKNGIDPQRICQYVLYFWEKNLSRHFASEESILFVSSEDHQVIRAIEEHQCIRTAIRALRVSDKHIRRELSRISDMVKAHVRFEERELFPYLESIPDKQAWTAVEKALAQPDPIIDDYADEFWKINRKKNMNIQKTTRISDRLKQIKRKRPDHGARYSFT